MAMRVMLAIVMMCAAACGDSASSGDELDCEGEARLLNYRACVGDDTYAEEWDATTSAGRDRDRQGDRPGPDDFFSCADNAAHMCYYDEVAHDDECRWTAAPYGGEVGGKPLLRCVCRDSEIWIDDVDRSRCIDD